MYQMDVEAADTSCPYHRSVVFPLVKYGAPEEIRTPNLLIRSAKFTHSGKDYVGFCVLRLRRRRLQWHPNAGVNGQSNGENPRGVAGVESIARLITAEKPSR